MPGPEHPPSPVYIPYVPEPVYLEFMPPEDDSSDDDEDDDDDVEEDEDEKEDEEHLALTDSVPPPVYRTTTKMSIRPQTPVPFLSEAEVDRLLSISTPPPSPLTSYSSPLPQIPSPPLPASPTNPLGYRAAMIYYRTIHYILAPRSETPPSGTPPLLPILLPTSSPPLLLPSTDCKADVPEVTLLTWKRLCIAPGPRFEIKESSSAPTARPRGGFRADYGFVGTLDAEIRRGPDREIGYGITNDTDEIYGRLDDAQDDRLLMSSQLNSLRRDRRSHARIARFIEAKARVSREAWLQSMDVSDTSCSETQMAALHIQQRPARDPAHPDVLEEAGSSS
ncbi:hypothetical protein Tco_0685993 [Tanacetum coccineum]